MTLTSNTLMSWLIGSNDIHMDWGRLVRAYFLWSGNVDYELWHMGNDYLQAPTCSLWNRFSMLPSTTVSWLRVKRRYSYSKDMDLHRCWSSILLSQGVLSLCWQGRQQSKHADNGMSFRHYLSVSSSFFSHYLCMQRMKSVQYTEAIKIAKWQKMTTGSGKWQNFPWELFDNAEVYDL